MTDSVVCPVCIFHASNITREQLRGYGWKCWNCGGDLSEHRMEQRENVQPSQAFAVNSEAVRKFPL